MKPLQIVLLLLLAVVFTGCGEALPEFSKVSGTITKNGKPVNLVEIRFVPLDEKFNRFIGKGVSDGEGKFTIKIPGREEDGCCSGKCKVTIREAPTPNELRGRLEETEGQGGVNPLKRYRASLRNRPIPDEYGKLHSTPLTFDVTPGEFDCNIEL